MKSALDAGTLGQCSLVTIAAFAGYFNTLFGTFVFDDTEAVIKNRDVLPSSSLSASFLNDFWGTEIASNTSHKSYRPLTVLSFRLNVLLSNSQLDPFQFHLTNVLLYAILCLLTIPVFNLFYDGKDQKTRTETSYWSCLLFTVHPIHTEAVASIVGRADILASIVFALSFLSFDKAVKRRSYPYLVLVIFLVALATMCKETAITALGVCCVYDVLSHFRLSTKKYLSWSKTRRRILILATSGIVILYFRLKIMHFTGPVFTSADNPAAFANLAFARIATHAYIYVLNLLLLLWPQWLCFDWSMGCIPLVKTINDYRILLVTFVFCILIVLLVSLCRKAPKHNFRCVYSVAMASSFALLPFLPATNFFMKVGFVIAERILILPSVGFCFLVVHGLKKLSKRFGNRKNVFRTLFTCLCAIFFFRTVQRNFDWLTEERLFNSALQVCPLNAKVHYNVGKVAADNDQKATAIEEYRRAIELNPRYEQAMNNLANLLRELKQFDEAETLLRQALKIRPNFAAAWMNLGIVLTNLNETYEAEQCYLTAISFRNKYPDCYYNLGNLYLDAKRNEEALLAWEKAVSFKPTHIAAWSNMLVLLDSLHRYKTVLEFGKTALMHNPRSAPLHFNIGNTLGKMRQFEKAEKHFFEALNLNPNSALYYSNLGVLYHRWQKNEKAIDVYRKALQIDPNLKTARNNLKKLIRL